MPRKELPAIPLSPYEAEIAEKLATAFALTKEDIVTKLVQDAIALRLRKNTGHRPARVYAIPTRTK